MKNTLKTGFTLIELLVVIVIIGVLATISVATFGNYISDSREAVLKNAVSTLSRQIKLQAIEASLTANILGGDGVDYAAVSVIDIINNKGISIPYGNICYGAGNGGFVVSGHMDVADGVDPEFFTKGAPAGITAFNSMSTTQKTECDFLANNPTFDVEENISFDEYGVASVEEAAPLGYYFACWGSPVTSCWSGESPTDPYSYGPATDEECTAAGDAINRIPC